MNSIDLRNCIAYSKMIKLHIIATVILSIQFFGGV